MVKEQTTHHQNIPAAAYCRWRVVDEGGRPNFSLWAELGLSHGRTIADHSKKIRCSDNEIELMGISSAFFMAGLYSNNVCAPVFCSCVPLHSCRSY